MSIKIAVIGAGSEMFGPGTIKDILLSDPLNEAGVDLVLMDIMADHLPAREKFARETADKLKRKPVISVTTDLDRALEDADYVVTAIEVDRYKYWAQDFHIPRRYGFMQIYGENGGPGALFHTLRNLPPLVHIARRMEELCPDAILLNFTNPESKLCQGISMLTDIRAFGLCHGVFMGKSQIARLLNMPMHELDTTACGMNHFSWFQQIRDRKTGRDLYPRLKEKEQQAETLAEWEELALSRVLFRLFGIWPSPGTNHHGEYIRWAGEFLGSSAYQFYYDPADGEPWETGKTPKYLYSEAALPKHVPLFPEKPLPQVMLPGFDVPHPETLKPSGELTVPIMEALSCGIGTELDAVVVPNNGAIPGMDCDCVVEVPATADAGGVRLTSMEPLPEAVTALLRVQGSIQKLLIEAYAEQSRDKLLQALLLDPTVHSYRNAVALINEMCSLQREILPPMHWQRQARRSKAAEPATKVKKRKRGRKAETVGV